MNVTHWARCILLPFVARSCTTVLLSNQFFDFFDVDGSGTLDSSEVLRMLLESQQKINENAGHLIETLYSMVRVPVAKYCGPLC